MEETSPLKGFNTRTRLAKDEGRRIITILATPFFDFGRAPPRGDEFKPKGLVEGTRAFGGGR